MTASRFQARRLLRGYEKDGDGLIERHELHLDRDALASVVGIQPDDPDLVYSYRLSPQQVEILATMAGLEIDPNRLDYFLEAVVS